MDEVSPLIALPFKLGNLISEDSVFATCVDISGTDLISNSRSLCSEASMTKLPLAPRTHENRYSSPNVSQNGVVIKIESNYDQSKDDRDNISVRTRQSESCLIFSNSINQDHKGDDPTALTGGPLAGILDSQYGINRSNSLCISRSIKKSDSWVSTIISEIVDDLVSVEESGVAVSTREPKRRFSTSLLEVSEEMKMMNKQIVALNFPPLWGSTSICGRRTEMEDSIIALPRFVQIPSKMLSDSPLFSSMHQELTAHLFGVYDGHGGSQV